MTSLRFWIALLTPYVSHPLYMRRGVWQPPPAKQTGFFNRIASYYVNHERNILLSVMGILVLAMIVLGYGVVIIAVVIVVVAAIGIGFPLALFATGTIYGLVSAMYISHAIINERLQGRYLILGVTPSGFLGASWALCSLSVQNSVVLRQLRLVFRMVFTMMLLMFSLPFIMTTGLYVVNVRSIQVYDIWAIQLIILGFLLMILIDFFQSACVGSLLGIIAAHHSETRADTQKICFGEFSDIASFSVFSSGFHLLIHHPADIGADCLSYHAILRLYLCRGVICVS